MFVLQTGVGVKIPWPGYLDPPPTYLFLKAQQIPYDIKKNCCSFSCHSCNRINSTGLNKKKMFHILVLESGMGVKIPQPGYLDPHPLFVFKSSINTTMIWNC